MPPTEYQLWTDIIDIVGPATFWPQSIGQNFWTRHLSHFGSILRATFIWLNGLNLQVYYDWCEVNSFKEHQPFMLTFNSYFAIFHKAVDIGCGHGMC